MNFTESFDQFSSRLNTMDLALYAGVGLFLWILFKDKLSPVQKVLTDLLNKVKPNNNEVSSFPVVDVVSVVPTVVDTNDVFFKLVASWKQTRDLAVKSGCSKAVEVADQMFPHLSPNTCGKDQVKV